MTADKLEIGRVEYGPNGSVVVCPCGARRPEAFYQSDATGKAVGVFDRLCVFRTCVLCGRVLTLEAVVVARREAATA